MRSLDEQDVVMMVRDAIIAHYHVTCGLCGVGAWIVCQLLDAEMMEATGHWYARSNVTGAILDPTVDQFSTIITGTPEADLESGREYAEKNLYPEGWPIDASAFPDYMYSESDWSWAGRAVARLKTQVQREAA